MKKVPEPNYQTQFKTAVWALQLAYQEYKRTKKKYIDCFFYGDDGYMVAMAEYEKYWNKMKELSSEIVRLEKRVGELRGKLNEKNTDNISGINDDPTCGM